MYKFLKNRNKETATKKTLFKMLFLFIGLLSYAESGFSYKTAKAYHEKEPDDTFEYSLKFIIPVPEYDKIYGSIQSSKDEDNYCIYVNSPCYVRMYFNKDRAFMPGMAIYNIYKKPVKLKTYASALRGLFNSRFLQFRILVPGFYFIKIRNLINGKQKENYKINFIPLDIDGHPYPDVKKAKKSLMRSMLFHL